MLRRPDSDDDDNNNQELCHAAQSLLLLCDHACVDEGLPQTVNFWRRLARGVKFDVWLLICVMSGGDGWHQPPNDETGLQHHWRFTTMGTERHLKEPSYALTCTAWSPFLAYAMLTPIGTNSPQLSILRHMVGLLTIPR